MSEWPQRALPVGREPTADTPRELTTALLVMGVVSLPQGRERCSVPPCAAKARSTSVGRKPPSQLQKAYRAYQDRWFCGRRSLPPAWADLVPVPLACVDSQ